MVMCEIGSRGWGLSWAIPSRSTLQTQPQIRQLTFWMLATGSALLPVSLAAFTPSLSRLRLVACGVQCDTCR